VNTKNATSLLDSRIHSGDIVIQNAAADLYIVRMVNGSDIDTSNDRFNAMRLACAAAQGTIANVWICVDEASERYHEVLCP
jgi:hypothetical protein